MVCGEYSISVFSMSNFQVLVVNNDRAIFGDIGMSVSMIWLYVAGLVLVRIFVLRESFLSVGEDSF